MDKYTDEQRQHAEQIRQIIRTVDEAAGGCATLTLDQLAQLLPINPEWAHYAPKRLRRGVR